MPHREMSRMTEQRHVPIAMNIMQIQNINQSEQRRCQQIQSKCRKSLVLLGIALIYVQGGISHSNE